MQYEKLRPLDSRRFTFPARIDVGVYTAQLSERNGTQSENRKRNRLPQIKLSAASEFTRRREESVTLVLLRKPLQANQQEIGAESVSTKY